MFLIFEYKILNDAFEPLISSYFILIYFLNHKNIYLLLIRIKFTVIHFLLFNVPLFIFIIILLTYLLYL